MILESAQMLCTVVNQNGGHAPYRSTHLHHPCTIWTGASLSNWRWLHRLALALNDEYRYRFRTNSEHKSATIIKKLSPPAIEDFGLTEFAQAVPEAYQVPGDAVAAYRRFYVEEKSRFARWTRRRMPAWLKTALLS